MNKITIIIIIGFISIGTTLAIISFKQSKIFGDYQNIEQYTFKSSKDQALEIENEKLFPMNIEALRRQKYPGGEFIVEKNLNNGTNYRQMVVSYLSEGLKIYGLLTIPLAPKPENGYPAIVFIHGHIPPKQYSTINNYPTYQAALARGGFITFGRKAGILIPIIYPKEMARLLPLPFLRPM